jgi:hypothetical protein
MLEANFIILNLSAACVFTLLVNKSKYLHVDCKISFLGMGQAFLLSFPIIQSDLCHFISSYGDWNASSLNISSIFNFANCKFFKIES